MARLVVLSTTAPVGIASDIPHRYDVIINGQGYRFAEEQPQRAIYSYSPTFVTRQNVQGDYGDNQQDFWMGAAQRDWTLGEQQKYFRSSDGKDQRFWQGTNLDVRTQGQVTIRQATKTLTFAAAVRATCPRGAAASQNIMAASASNLYEVAADGAITDRGAHGLGAAPARFGMATDGTDVYLSTTAGGTVGVRKWDGSSFTTFSADGADSLEFLNNSLYGLRGNDGKLVRWSTAGVQSTVHPWQQADGGTRGGNAGRIRAFGGKLLVLWADGPNGAELWTYDGTAAAMTASFPSNFYAHELEVVYGQVFISGAFVKINAGVPTDFLIRPAVYFYSNQLGILWRASAFGATVTTNLTTANHPGVAAFDDGLVFTDDTRGQIMFYDITVGGVCSIGSYTVAGDTPLLAASQRFFLHTRNHVTGYLHPDTTTIATSGTLKSSLMDFDSSLPKRFHSIRIDADIPAGASVDLLQRDNDVDGAYTAIVTGAESGEEYAIGVNARALSIQATLNKGSSTAGPTLKRTSLRGAPILDTFKRRQYALDLTSRNEKTPLELRDHTLHPKDGLVMAQELIQAAVSTTPITIIDRFDTYTGVIIAEEFKLIEIRPEEFIAVCPIREV